MSEPTRPFEIAPLEELWGWGRSLGASSHVLRPSTPDGVERAFALAREHGLSIGLRGAGQSYGDAALLDRGLALDLSRLTRVLDWDPAAGVIRVEPGVTIGQLWRYAIEDGFWPAVVPGTSLATVGGCVSANVHGKNNWKVGPFGEHVESLELLLPGGERLTCTREHEPEVFHAAIGGFGLLGAILSVTLRLKRVHSGLLDVEPLAARNLDEALATFEERLERADYLVGWIDAFARRGALGRGLIHQARYLPAGADPAPQRTLRREAQELPDALFHVLPKSEAWRVLRLLFHPAGMAAVNIVKYRQGRRVHGRAYREPHAQFAFLLDFFPGWKRAYGPHGMIQYQSFVPATEARRVFRTQLELAQQSGLVPLLGVLKRHRCDAFTLGHGVDGYSLALEFRIPRGRRADLWALCREMDPLVLDAGGGFYFAKDSTLSRDSLATYLRNERVQRFLALKRRLDPDGLLATDLYRRLLAGQG